MTISNTLTKEVYSGNDVATVFSYGFPISENSDLDVYVDAGAGLGLELQTITTDYTVSGAGTPSGGNITFAIAPLTITGGNNVVIQRTTPLTQQTDYIEGDTFPATAHEEALDKLTRIVQELKEQLDRSVKTAINDDSDPALLIAAINNAVITTAADAAAADADAAAALASQTAAAASAAAASASQTAAANSASSASTSASNAATAETNAETAATNAATSASNAAASETAAATSETAAAASASAAATSETNAETAETNAETAATNAAASGVAAAASAAEAAASAASVARTGEVFDWPLATPPAYGLVCNGAAVSRATYSDLFDIIGTEFGAGDGVTTFNLPNIPAGYATLQSNGSNEGDPTVGQVLNHQHDTVIPVRGFSTSGSSDATRLSRANDGGGTSTNTVTSANNTSGAAANFAAGVYFRKCIHI